MIRKRNSDSAKRELINMLRNRIKVLHSAKQIYGYNNAFPENVKFANMGIIQNDLETLSQILKSLTKAQK